MLLVISNLKKMNHWLYTFTYYPLTHCIAHRCQYVLGSALALYVAGPRRIVVDSKTHTDTQYCAYSRNQRIVMGQRNMLNVHNHRDFWSNSAHTHVKTRAPECSGPFQDHSTYIDLSLSQKLDR
jgi:hypothetical protein